MKLPWVGAVMCGFAVSIWGAILIDVAANIYRVYGAQGMFAVAGVLLSTAICSVIIRRIS